MPLKEMKANEEPRVNVEQVYLIIERLGAKQYKKNEGHALSPALICSSLSSSNL